MAIVKTKHNASELLREVSKLDARSFRGFVNGVLSLRARREAPSLPRREAQLLRRINAGLSEEMRDRYDRLAKKRATNTLTKKEHRDLLRLTSAIEGRQARRAAALAELAQLRNQPVRSLMKQLGIKASPVHG